MSQNHSLGVVGLGVMGANLARNIASRGHSVAVYNRTTSVMESLLAAHPDEGLVGYADLAELVDSLESPKKVLLMVTAGRAVDRVLDVLLPMLSTGDIVIDGGNSHFPDTERRVSRCEEVGVRYVGMGVSGGEEGALKGPAMMPGGDNDAWPLLRPLLEPAAAVSDSGSCVTWCGQGGAGHFVKMVHNGIEYGDMQLIAEVWTLLREGLGMDAVQTRQVFESWNQGRLSSFLIDITATLAAAKDPQTGEALVDHVLDAAGQKGTGRWTGLAALDATVPAPTLVAAVDARVVSARRDERALVSPIFGDDRAPLDLTVEDLEAALYVAKIMSYTQGFALIRQVSNDKGWGTDLADVARGWKAGCIIRAVFLDRVYQAFKAEPDLPLLMLDSSFAQEVRQGLGALRKVVAAAVLAGHPVPALASALGYVDDYRRSRGGAALIQAQRDFFGAHTYRRIEDIDTAVHTEWAKLEQL